MVNYLMSQGKVCVFVCVFVGVCIEYLGVFSELCLD